MPVSLAPLLLVTVGKVKAKKSRIMISVVLPVFNEGKNIAKQVEAIEKKLDFDHEVLIVYDFDEDDTVPVARNLIKKYKNVRLVKNIFGRGIINAVKTGFKKSVGDCIVVMPADLADNPVTINKMYKKIKEGFDVVCATRYGRGGAKVGGPIIKSLLSRLAGLATPLLLGIPTTDIANGFKMYRREVIGAIKIESTGGWEFATEVIIKAHHAGFKIGEVPTVWRDRLSGKSKFKMAKWLPKYLRWYLWGIYKRL